MIPAEIEVKEEKMLGWFGLPETMQTGAADRLIAALAEDLQREGARLAGAVQVNIDAGPDRDCDMDVHVIGDDSGPIRISQVLGAHSDACRLDAGALEMAVERVAGRLAGADLLIVPKFGRQEAMGRGFYHVIGQAIMQDIPVLLHVPIQQREAFANFAEGMAVRIAPDAVTDWCRARLALAA